MLWDVDVPNVTGVDKKRVRHKIQDAYRQFDGDGADVTNVVILQADRTTVHLSAVSEALYGGELFHMGSDAFTRTPDGLLSRGLYSALHAVLVARRGARLFAPYDLALFSASSSRVPPESIARAFDVERVLGPSHLL